MNLKLILLRLSKFLLSGGLNFGLTYLVYLGALFFLSYQASYVLAYVVGIVFSYFINRQFVFEANYTHKQLILYPLIYIAQLVFSLLLGRLWVDVLGCNEKWMPIFSAMICIPPTFVLMHFLFKNGEHK